MQRVLLERGRMFLERAGAARAKIASLSVPFVGKAVLTHSHSRVVAQALLRAHEAGRRFHVSSPVQAR